MSGIFPDYFEIYLGIFREIKIIYRIFGDIL